MRDLHLLPDSTPISIAADRARLRGTLFRPSGTLRAAAVLHGATGVPARFYTPFARWLAGTRGVAVLTCDYRDFGASGVTQGSPATMTDWGVRDQQAGRDWLAAELPDVPLWVIGHSLGGMMLPYQTGLDGIARVISVASGTGHVSAHPWPYQAFARAFWAPGVGALSRRLGRFPGKALRIGHDLPAGVYAQWRQWCLSRESHGADPDLPPADARALTCPMRVVAVADDALCPPATVWQLMQAYSATRKQQVVIRPGDYGLRRIGHLDVLGARGKPCWADVVGA